MPNLSSLDAEIPADADPKILATAAYALIVETLMQMRLGGQLDACIDIVEKARGSLLDAEGRSLSPGARHVFRSAAQLVEGLDPTDWPARSDEEASPS